RPADGRLGRHVPDDETMAAAGEPPVRDQCNLVAETAPDDRAGRAQHLAHSGSAARTLVADHDDIAGDDRSVEDRSHGLLLRAETARAAFEAEALLAGDLGDRALRREVAVQHGKVAVLFDRRVERPDDVLPFRIRLDVREV